MPLHDALPVVGEAAPACVRLEHRRLGLLDLEEQRVGVVATEHEGDPAPGPDAPDPDDLPGEVDEPVALEQVAAIGLQRAPVHPDPVFEPHPELVELVARERDP